MGLVTIIAKNTGDDDQLWGHNRTKVRKTSSANFL